MTCCLFLKEDGSSVSVEGNGRGGKETYGPQVTTPPSPNKNKTKIGNKLPQLAVIKCSSHEAISLSVICLAPVQGLREEETDRQTDRQTWGGGGGRE